MLFSKAVTAHRTVLSFVVFLFLCSLFFSGAQAAVTVGVEKAPPSVIDTVNAGQPQDLIVLLDDTAVQQQAALMREGLGIHHDDEAVLMVKAASYDAIKADVLATLPPTQYETLKDYSHLPMMFVRINSQFALDQLLGHLKVLRVYLDGKYSHFLTSSLPFINQPAVQAAGKVGTGATVAVLDTGVDYTRSAFGSCTSPAPGYCSDTSPPAAPPGCKVACARDFTPTNDGFLDDNGHGTNVSGIVVGVAPDTRIAALDVFRPDGFAYDSDLTAAINWCIANKTAYNIVAINMSLGGGGSTSPCGGDALATPVNSARGAGILSSIASGNNGFTNSISSPACVPAAVSVGAVYDGNIGGITYSNCADATTAADKVTCFSNSASFLTILAPGAQITAAGITSYGTSQAAPHIAGSIAVIKGANAFPSDTPDQTVDRMTSTGVQVLDTRNGITKPRINLLAAVQGVPPATFSISGTIRTAGGGFGGGSGTPIAGVTVALSGASSATTTTNASGVYTFTGLANGSYTVTPSMAGYAFTPTNRAVTLNNANVTAQDFTGTVVPVTYSISGTVSSAPAGVTMTLSGAATGMTLTDASGAYTFSGLVNGSYTVTPSLAGFTFTPPNRAVTINNANITGQDFTGTASAITYSISGTITTPGTLRLPGSPISGVTVTLSGAASGTTTTDASGNYIFTGLANGSYTVTPSTVGYAFTPTSRSVNINNANITGQDFTGTASAVTYSISGTVRTGGGTPISGVTMALSGASTGTTTADVNGNYTFTGLANGNYTVTPSMAGYAFTPTSRSVNINNANVTGQDFTGTPSTTTYSISGTITTPGTLRLPGSPISGVTVTLSGAASGTTTTDASGNYSFIGLANGSYTVTPFMAGYAFTPTSRSVNINNANVTGQDFTRN